MAKPLAAKETESATPEKLDAASKTPGWRAAYFSAPKPPMLSPATARPPLVANVASTHGSSSPNAYVSYFGVPPAYGSLYQPLGPPSGMTTISGYGAVSCSARPLSTQER